MLLSNQIFELEQQVEGVEVIVGVAKVTRGNIQQISYIPQTEQFSLLQDHPLGACRSVWVFSTVNRASLSNPLHTVFLAHQCLQIQTCSHVPAFWEVRKP